MTTKTKTYFIVALCCMVTFIGLHTAIICDFVHSSYNFTLIAMGCFALYLPTSSLFLKEILNQQKKDKQMISDKINALNVSNMIVLYDQKGKVIRANELFCNATQCLESELLGKDYTEICDPKQVQLWKVLLEGKHIRTEFQKVTTKDGSSVFISGTYSPIKSPNGQVYQVIQIAIDVTDDYITKAELIENNTYLEHAAKILRHDMHSGINTYMPRGVKSLERRLEKITALHRKSLNIDTPLKLIKEGLAHSQRVYRGVTEFTNLVRKDVEIERSPFDIGVILKEYLSQTSYSDQVKLENLPKDLLVNEALFCTAIDNLIRNGLKYNDSDTKIVTVTMKDENHLAVIDNGRGIKQKDFVRLSQPYQRKPNQKERGTGLGLNICVAILKEHKFTVSIDDDFNDGTCILIRINQ